MDQKASIMAEQLRYNVQLLMPIPDEKETEIVYRLVGDAHGLFIKITLSEEEILSLLKRWFAEGQGYEGKTVAVPADIEEVLKDLMTFEVKGFFESLFTDMDCLCRLIWAWFQRGRAFERGNALDTAFLSEEKYLSN